jgi:hypothetical protein
MPGIVTTNYCEEAGTSMLGVNPKIAFAKVWFRFG